MEGRRIKKAMWKMLDERGDHEDDWASLGVEGGPGHPDRQQRRFNATTEKPLALRYCPTGTFIRPAHDSPSDISCVNVGSDQLGPSPTPSMDSTPTPLARLVLTHSSFPIDKRTTTVAKFKPFTINEKESWLNADPDHGFIRVYEANAKESILQRTAAVDLQSKLAGSRSIVVPCTAETTCRQICDKLGIFDNELHVTFNGDTIRRLEPSEKPLRVQDHYLAIIGLTNGRRKQEAGDSLDLCYLIKFTAGRPVLNDEYGRSTLSCYCLVRKGRVFHHWTKRLCVLNSARLLIYPSLDRNGTPEVIALSRAKVEDIHLRSRGRCIKITVATPRRPVQTFYIGFDSAIDLNTWLSRCLKGAAKVPPISDLSNLQLEYLPEQVFCVGSERLLTQLNLRRNCLKRRPPNSDSFTIGWLDDLPRLESLRSLNLADNDLRACPSAVFQLHALTELVLSGNKLSELPAAVGNLRNLQLLNLQNNWLSDLPLELIECDLLINLDLSFNRFTHIPDILGDLSSLDHWILNGNDIERFLDEGLIRGAPYLRKIELRRCKLVQSAISAIPVGLLPLLTHLDIRDNRSITSLDLKSLPSLQVLSCVRCSLHDLQLNGSALTSLFAMKNNLRNVVIMPVPKQLKIFDVSCNNLHKLPDWLTELGKIEKIVASHNRLISIPHRMFTSVSSLKTLILNHNNISSLPSEVENCFIEYLDLHHNRLTELPPEFLASAHKLRVLNLSENQLVDSPPLNPFLDLNKVQQLYLACNRLSDSAIPVISGYRRLRILDLAYNNIKEIYDGCIEKLTLLESMNVSGNKLRCLPASLARLPNLAVLRAHSNRLASLPDFSEAGCLKVLDCASNQLESVDVRHLLSPQLKHLDISCNPRLRFDTTTFQQFRSERLVSLIDMSRESRSAIVKEIRPSRSDALAKPHWQAGFSETSGERNKLCVSQIRCLTFQTDKMGKNGNGALFAVIDGGLNNELPQHLTSRLPDILRDELNNANTGREYLKYAILNAHQGLRTSGQKMGASCAVCHIQEIKNEKEDSGRDTVPMYKLGVANVGHTEAVLCRKGKAITLTRTFLLEDASVEEMERVRKAGAIVTEDNEVNGITPCSRLLGCNFLYPVVIPCPHVINVDLEKDDEFLLMASRGLWEVMGHTEAIRRIRRMTNPILAAKHLQDVAQSYGYKENLSILVVRFLFNASGESNSDNGAGSSTIPLPNLKRPTLGMALSAVNVAESDDCSLTSDDDVKSEPRDRKSVRDPPNYYFEYKKQLKQIMLETGSSDVFSVNGQDSLYSVATLVHADQTKIGDVDFPIVSGTVENGEAVLRYFDDGYQSSEMGTPNPVRLNFADSVGLGDNAGYASVIRSIGRCCQHSPIENGDVRNEKSNGQQDSPSSACSSCSSGLGKSSVAVSPDDHSGGAGCERSSQMARWIMDDEDALLDAKQRFQQARRIIFSKLGNGGNANPPPSAPRAHIARMAVLGGPKDESTRSPDSIRPDPCPICASKGHGIDVAVSTEFVDSTVDAKLNGKEKISKRRSGHQQMSMDDSEIFNSQPGPATQENAWYGCLSSAHSDDQIQCRTRWEEDQEYRPPLPAHGPPAIIPKDTRATPQRTHPVLLVDNMDLDGTGPQSVVFCEHNFSQGL